MGFLQGHMQIYYYQYSLFQFSSDQGKKCEGLYGGWFPLLTFVIFHGCTMQRPPLFPSFLLRLTMFSSCPLELKGTCAGPCQPLPGATCLSIGNSLNDFVPGCNTEVSRSFCEIGTKPKRSVGPVTLMAVPPNYTYLLSP